MRREDTHFLSPIGVPTKIFWAEQDMLGLLLVCGRDVGHVFEIVKIRDLSHLRHQLLLEAIHKVWREEHPVDIVTVSAELRSRGELQAAGGIPYIAYLARKAPLSTDFEERANVVRIYAAWWASNRRGY